MDKESRPKVVQKRLKVSPSQSVTEQTQRGDQQESRGDFRFEDPNENVRSKFFRLFASTESEVGQDDKSTEEIREKRRRCAVQALELTIDQQDCQIDQRPDP